MTSLLSSFSGMAQTTVVPMIFKFIETQEPMLEDALVDQLNKLKTPATMEQFNVFLGNWRKINNAIERSAQSLAPVAPVVPVMPAPAVGGAAMGVVPDVGGAAMGVVPAVGGAAMGVVPDVGGAAMGVVPASPQLEETPTAGTRKRRRHKKRTHKVKHRKH